jgi:hypothetical protein
LSLSISANRLYFNSPAFRTSAKLRHGVSRLTGNAAASNAYRLADMASLLQAVRNAGSNNVVILGAGVLERLLAVEAAVSNIWPFDSTGSASPTLPPRTPAT